MAASRLPKPGSKLGPCKRCEHRDCRETRATADSACRYCGGVIGFEVRYYRDPDGPAVTPFAYVHAACHEDAIEGRS